MLVPITQADTKLAHEEIVEGLCALRQRVKPGKMSTREMVNEKALLKSVVVGASVALAAFITTRRQVQTATALLITLEAQVA